MKELRKLLMACGEETDRETANRIFDLVRTEEEMYTIIVRVTNNFYMDEEDGVPTAWIFTDHSFAEDNVRNIRDLGLEVREMEIAPKQRLGFFNDLYRSGIEAITIITSSYHQRRANILYQTLAEIMSLFNLITRPDEETGSTLNPGLVRAANRFYQGISKNRVTPQDQKEFSRELAEAMYLIPMNPETGKNPMVTNKAGGKYFAVFSDPTEFFKFDRKHIYEAGRMSFKDLRKLAKKADGIVVNPFGFGLGLDLNKIDRILEELSVQ